ncbi:MAG: tRNA lysidine(34) synthetase TilS [Gemmatimonadetes bacterium]|nr:tRNA lysidine(34) synthetase TilS [Gemmatimonadota bacterium]
MQANDLATRLRDHLRATGLFPEPGLAVLAVSGGPDSVVMLDLMVRVAPEFGLRLAVVHVDHGIADESSDVAEQVLGLAVQYDIPGYLSVLHLGSDASETQARSARYTALRQWQRKLGAVYLATAHHADDQIETVLFRLLRGTGLAGLAGIAARGSEGLVRPLLPFRRAELDEWLQASGRGLAVHSDPANADLRHHRSWIRGELLPVIRDRFGIEVEDHLLDVASHAADDRAAWSAVLRTAPDIQFRVVQGLAEIARDALCRCEAPLGAALLRAAAREVGCVLGPRRAARLWDFARRAPSGRRFELGQGWVAETAFGRLRILMSKELTQIDRKTVRWGDGDAGRVRWGRWEICWSQERAGTPARDAIVTWVTEGWGEIRGLLPGDRILPLGGVGHRRVSRVLMERRIPRSERKSFPLLTRGESVIWLPGICRSDVAVPEPGEAAVRLEVTSVGDP